MPRQVLVTASAMVWRCHAGLQTNEPARLRPNPGTIRRKFYGFFIPKRPGQRGLYPTRPTGLSGPRVRVSDRTGPLNSPSFWALEAPPAGCGSGETAAPRREGPIPLPDIPAKSRNSTWLPPDRYQELSRPRLRPCHLSDCYSGSFTDHCNLLPSQPKMS